MRRIVVSESLTETLLNDRKKMIVAVSQTKAFTGKHRCREVYLRLSGESEGKSKHNVPSKLGENAVGPISELEVILK